MGLTTNIQSAIGKAFSSALSDAANDLVLSRETNTFNPATNTTVKTTETFTSRGVIGRYASAELRDDAVKPTDSKILILQNELATTPVVDDYILANGLKYKVILVSKDPANVTWNLQCRQ